MRPYPEEVLRAIQSGIVTHFAPEIASNYGKAQFAFSMLLFGVIQRDYDTAVPDLIESNRTLRALLADASAALAGIAGEDARAARDAIGALPTVSASLRLSALRAEHDALRDVICKSAALLEPAADRDDLAPLRAARAAIYAWLLEDAKKRVVPILTV